MSKRLWNQHLRAVPGRNNFSNATQHLRQVIFNDEPQVKKIASISSCKPKMRNEFCKKPSNESWISIKTPNQECYQWWANGGKEGSHCINNTVHITQLVQDRCIYHGEDLFNLNKNIIRYQRLHISATMIHISWHECATVRKLREKYLKKKIRMETRHQCDYWSWKVQACPMSLYHHSPNT